MTQRTFFDPRPATAQPRTGDAADDGYSCPACGQLVKRYRRALHAGMAAAVVWLVGRTESDRRAWVHVGREGPRDVLRSKDFGLLRFWGLLEQEHDARGRTTGRWRPTALGVRWAYGVCTVPKYAVFLCGSFEGLEGPELHAVEALGDRFDREELLGRGRV